MSVASMSVVGKSAVADWTIMVYIAADDKLANFAVESLKQLRKAVESLKQRRKSGGSNVLVAAQLDADGSEEALEIRRYVFGKSDAAEDDEPLENFVVDRLPADTDMTDPNTLADFVSWAHEQCKSENYCLILWGHGPELLFEGPVKIEHGKKKRLYLTPVQLRDALQTAQERTGKKLSIIGLDACSMSMIEYASELHDLAEFMVASQEEVPDQSFPYDTLVERFADHQGSIEELVKTSLEYYVRAYRDYICTPKTGMKEVQLSALRLNGTMDSKGPSSIKETLQHLVTAMREDHDAAIYEARREARGFVGGLFVDLEHFLQRLKTKLRHKDKDLQKACEAVSRALADCVFAVAPNPNKSLNHCHGLSIYFPYLKNDEQADIENFHLIKGAGGSQGDTIGKGAGGSQGDTIGKGAGGSQGDTIGKSAAIVNDAASEIQYAVRREIIRDTERYYKKKDKFTFAESGWYDFIRSQWSRILADREKHQLDLRYSAEQCARNLLSIAERAPERTKRVAV